MPEVFHDVMKFLSTPSARRATKFKYPKQPDLEISIHALREEGDQISQLSNRKYSVFLSTPSARRATEKVLGDGQKAEISIHALREEGDLNFCGWIAYKDYFYPRPPRGGRPHLLTGGEKHIPFLSTPSARRATRYP